MDQIVHSLTGLATARMSKFKRVRYAVFWGVLGANAPDLDVLTRMVGDPIAYLAHHRTWTHSLFGLVLFYPIVFLMPERWVGDTRNWRRLVFLNLILHIMMDLTTTWPTYLFWPITKRGYHLDWQFILGVPIWIVGIFYVVLDRLMKTHRNALASFFLIYMGFYFLHAGWSHEQAIRFFTAQSLPVRAMMGESPLTDDNKTERGDPGIIEQGNGRFPDRDAILAGVPLPFLHGHRLILFRRGEFIERYEIQLRDKLIVPLGRYDLRACPDPQKWKDQHRVSRIYFRFADIWVCIQVPDSHTYVYFNPRFDYRDLVARNFPRLRRFDGQIPFVLRVRFLHQQPNDITYLPRIEGLNSRKISVSPGF